MTRNLKLLVLSAALLALAVINATADHGSIWEGGTHTLYFPHFGNGDDIVSEIILVNYGGPGDAKPMIRLSNDEGEVLSVDGIIDMSEEMEMTEDGDLTLNIPPSSVFILRTNGKGAVVKGSIVVKSHALLRGYVRYTTSIGNASVGTSFTGTALVVPFQKNASVNTALALHNVTSKNGSAKCWLSQDGERMGEVEFTLPANGQYSRYVYEMFPENDADSVGIIECSTTRRVAGLALDTGANGGLSSLPVVQVKFLNRD